MDGRDCKPVSHFGRWGYYGMDAFSVTLDHWLHMKKLSFIHEQVRVQVATRGCYITAGQGCPFHEWAFISNLCTHSFIFYHYILFGDHRGAGTYLSILYPPPQNEISSKKNKWMDLLNHAAAKATPEQRVSPTDRERTISHHESHVTRCHVLQSLPTDLVRSGHTLLYHVGVVWLQTTSPAARACYPSVKRIVGRLRSCFSGSCCGSDVCWSSVEQQRTAACGTEISAGNKHTHTHSYTLTHTLQPESAQIILFLLIVIGIKLNLIQN